MHLLFRNEPDVFKIMVVGWISWTWFRSCKDNEGDSIIFTHISPNTQCIP